jgi:hypothetical protein
MVSGTLVGMVVAAYARGDFKRLFTFESVGESLAFEPEASFRGYKEGLNLRREASEGAGDPTLLTPALTTRPARQSVSIERAGGAPGGIAAHEILEVPGHPGQPLDHSDSAQSVRSASRTHRFSTSKG